MELVHFENEVLRLLGKTWHYRLIMMMSEAMKINKHILVLYGLNFEVL